MENGIQYSLQTLGFRFNPFEHLEASQDPHLSEYLVGHDSFDLVSQLTPAVVLAPPGAGKTAMRIYVSRSCASTFGRNRPLPINYSLPEAIADTSQTLSLSQHKTQILRRGTISLLTGLAYFPELFLELSYSDQKNIGTMIHSVLKTPPADYFLGLLSSGNPLRLANRFDRSYTALPLPAPQHVIELCNTLINTYKTSSLTIVSLQDFAAIVQGTLKFQKVFVLVDGIDGFSGSTNNPPKATQLINSLLMQIMDLSDQDWIIKGFFPPEILGELALPESVQSIMLDWTVDSLAQMLRRRIYTATSGQFETLDALCSLNLQNVECILAKSVLPLPREVIFLANQLLIAFSKRHSTFGSDSIALEDLKEALRIYGNQKHIVQIG